MGNVLSRNMPNDEQHPHHTMAERINQRKQSGIVLVMRWFARVLHKIAISAKIARTPTVATYPRPRQRHIASLETVDTIDDMRRVIAALGGWEEQRESLYSVDSMTDSTFSESVLSGSVLSSHTVGTDRTEATDRTGTSYRAALTQKTGGSRSSAYSTSTGYGPPSIRLAERATRMRPGLLSWSGKGRQRASAAYSDFEDVMEVLEDDTVSELPLPPRVGRDGNGSESSRDTDVASIIMRRSFGERARRPPSPSLTI